MNDSEYLALAERQKARARIGYQSPAEKQAINNDWIEHLNEMYPYPAPVETLGISENDFSFSF